jgi:predicted O-methyltransferase YrrM
MEQIDYIQERNEEIFKYLREQGIEFIEGCSGYHYYQSRDLYNIINTYKPLIAMEIGFNAGHSASAFLSSFNDLLLVSFDLGRHNYINLAKELIDYKYPDRHTLVIGDSRKTVPEFYRHNPDIVFDMIFIDGGHMDDIPEKDIINSIKMADRETIIVIDDIVYNPELQDRWNIEPTKALQKLINDNILKEIKHYEYYKGVGMSVCILNMD